MNQEKKTIPRITMRVSILSIFLLLLAFAFTSVLFFIYQKNFEAVSELSQGRMKLVKFEVSEKVSDLFSSAEQIVALSGNCTVLLGEISPENELLKSYLCSVIKNYSTISAIYIGAKDGDFLQATNISLSGQTHYFSEPEKRLQKEVAYEWKFSKILQGKVQQTSLYLDQNLHVVDSETYQANAFDARKRPWYQGAEETKELFWTNPYMFFDTKRLGISASFPIQNSQQEVFAVIGVDLSFTLLSHFFINHLIGKTGKPFILDQQGAILIPEKSMFQSSVIDDEELTEAFQIFNKHKKNFFRFTSHGERYLAHIEPFPVKLKAQWLLAIIVPFNDFFSNFEHIQKKTFLMIISILIGSSFIVIYFAKLLSKPIVILAREIDSIKKLDFTHEERVHSAIKEIFLMDQSISSMRSAMHSFSRYVPKEIVRNLLSKNKDIALGGEKKEVSILFSDIENFTSITEEQPTELLMKLLAEYFDSLSKIILESQGTIDKYIGDSIMAFWGAPLELSHHTILCAEAALQCKAFVHTFNKERTVRGEPLFKTRFGINTGVAIVGNIGTRERMNYTLIGDMVNTASRLQQTNKLYNTEIIISQKVEQELGNQFLTRPLDVIEVKGKKEKIAIYELVAMQPTPQEIRLCKKFTEAYTFFQSGDLAQAKVLFTKLHTECPDDYPTKIYMNKLDILLEH